MKNIHDINRFKLKKDMVILIILGILSLSLEISVISKKNSIDRIISKERK